MLVLKLSQVQFLLNIQTQFFQQIIKATKEYLPDYEEKMENTSTLPSLTLYL